MRKSAALGSLVFFAVVALAACKHSTAEDGSRGPEPSLAEPPDDTRVALGESQMKSGGRTRSFLFYTPARADGQPLPMVLALHGRLGNGKGMAKLSHLQRIAAREGFVVVFPDGYRRSWHDLRESGPAAEDQVDDVGFLTDLVSLFVKEHGVDPARVYVAGMSNGGFMAGTLACKATTVFAAFAEVAATASFDLSSTCKPAAPVPGLFIVGELDPLVPYRGGPIARDDSGKKGVGLAAEPTARFFAKANGCTAEAPSDLPDADPGDTLRSSLLSFTGCTADASVDLITVHGGGHAWPGGWGYLPERLIGKTTRDFEASERIWAFFKDKRRAARPPGP
jgi:polyhydroxybutyrate depolymerase